MGRHRLYEPVTIGAILFLLFKLLVALAPFAGTYYKFASANVAGLGDVKAELVELKTATERKYIIKGVTTKRVETLEYTLNFEPVFQWNSAIDARHRPQLIKVIQEGIEATAEEKLKRKVSVSVPLKQTSQIELDPSQAQVWEIEVREEIVLGRVSIAQKNEPVVMPFELVITKTLQANPIHSRWWWPW